MWVFGMPQQTNELMASEVSWFVTAEGGIRLRAARSVRVLTCKNREPSSVMSSWGTQIRAAKADRQTDRQKRGPYSKRQNCANDMDTAKNTQNTELRPRSRVASFLGSWQFHSKSAHSTGTEGSSPCSQQPASCSYPESHQHSQPFQSASLKTHFNIILLATPESSKWSLSFRFPHQNPVNTAPISHTCHMPHPSHSSWFDLPNIWSAVQIMKLHTV